MTHQSSTRTLSRPRAGMSRWFQHAGLALTGLFLAAPTVAEGQVAPTKVLVRVVSHDAKIIGSGVGGASVTIRDAVTGQVLALGRQEGSTGDTRRIMLEPRRRDGTVYNTDGAAGFLATLELEEPTVVEITAEGPLATPQARQRASKTMLLVPGKDVVGEGVILELMGFTVILASPSDSGSAAAGRPFEIRATVTMLCGCPTEPGGMWDARDIEIVAVIMRGHHVLDTLALTYAGKRNTYHATATVEQPGPIQIQVVAMDPAKANFGMATRTVDVLPR